MKTHLIHLGNVGKVHWLHKVVQSSVHTSLEGSIEIWHPIVNWDIAFTDTRMN